MAVNLAQALGWAVIALGVAIYLGAVGGVLFGGATPPLDVGAVSTLVVCLLFGALALALSRKPAV